MLAGSQAVGTQTDMAQHSVYFAGSIRGGRDDAALYLQIVEYLKEKYVVLTEHVASDELTIRGEAHLSEQQIHDRDMAWLRQSNAECTQPSLGVGYEIGRAVELKKPIVCLFRPSSGRSLSAMIAGATGEANFFVLEYTELPELLPRMSQILDKLFP